MQTLAKYNIDAFIKYLLRGNGGYVFDGDGAGAGADAIYHFGNEEAKKYFRSHVSLIGDPNGYNYHGDTKLTAACRWGDRELFDLVIGDNKVNINMPEKVREHDRHDPPILVVMDAKDYRVNDSILYKIETLLNKGASVNSCDNYGNTLLMLASGAGRISRYCGSGKVYPLEFGCCDYNAPAMYIGNKILKMLVERNDINVNATNKAGQSALDIAKMINNKEGIEILTNKLNS